MKKIFSILIIGCLILSISGAVDAETDFEEVNPGSGSGDTDLLDGDLDQSQTLCDGTIPVGRYDPMIGENSLIVAQSFVPTKEILTKVELYMGVNMTTIYSCKVAIRSSLTGEDLTHKYLNPNAFTVHFPDDDCDNLSWEVFNFPNIFVTPGQTYYIVVSTINASDNCYWLAGTDGDPYPDGNVSISFDDGETWEYISDGDGCFKTYGRNNLPPNTPSTPSGPSSGEAGEWYMYYTITTDPDGDDVRYGLDINNDDVIDHWSEHYYSSGDQYYINIRFHSPGLYYLRFKAEDIYGAQSDFSTALIVAISSANDPPETPDTPEGETLCNLGVSYTYITSSNDPNDDYIEYGWDWDGDDEVDEWTNLYSSGTEISISHIWTTEGTYNVKVKAKDEHGKQSDFSAPLTVTVSDNNPPDKPDKPSGPAQGRPGSSYSYFTFTIDPEDDNVYCMWDWDDGTTSGWQGPFTSGETYEASHIFNSQGTYCIKVKAKDEHGAESVWSDPLSVTMPKSKFVIHPLLQSLSEKFPLIAQLLHSFPIFQQLLNFPAFQ